MGGEVILSASAVSVVMRLGQIGQEAEKLVALLTLVTGEGFESFSKMTDHLQHSALALAADMAMTIRQIADGEGPSPEPAAVAQENTRCVRSAAAAERLDQLMVLFATIRDQIEEGTHAHSLAKLGVGIAADYSHATVEEAVRGGVSHG